MIQGRPCRTCGATQYVVVPMGGRTLYQHVCRPAEAPGPVVVMEPSV